MRPSGGLTHPSLRDEWRGCLRAMAAGRSPITRRFSSASPLIYRFSSPTRPRALGRSFPRACHGSIELTQRADSSPDVIWPRPGSNPYLGSWRRIEQKRRQSRFAEIRPNGDFLEGCRIRISIGDANCVMIPPGYPQRRRPAASCLAQPPQRR